MRRIDQAIDRMLLRDRRQARWLRQIHRSGFVRESGPAVRSARQARSSPRHYRRSARSPREPAPPPRRCRRESGGAFAISIAPTRARKAPSRSTIATSTRSRRSSVASATSRARRATSRLAPPAIHPLAPSISPALSACRAPAPSARIGSSSSEPVRQRCRLDPAARSNADRDARRRAWPVWRNRPPGSAARPDGGRRYFSVPPTKSPMSISA